MFDFINEIPEDTLTKMIKYYKIPITPDNYISKEIIRVFKPYLSTIRVTLFNQYKHLNIEDPIVFQTPNNTSPDQSFITRQKDTPKDISIVTNPIKNNSLTMGKHQVTNHASSSIPHTIDKSIQAFSSQNPLHPESPCHASPNISATSTHDTKHNHSASSENISTFSSSNQSINSLNTNKIQCNSLKFAKPKVKEENEFPPEELSDLETLRRVCLSIDKRMPLYPEFQQEQDAANTTRNKQKYAKLAAKEKVPVIQNNEDVVRINFLDMGGDTFFMIPIKIFGKKYFCLTDSGCQRSILSEKIIPDDKPITSTPITLSTCTDNNKKATGTLDIETTFFTIENKEMTMNIPFVIVGKEYTNNFMGIIGRDILHSKLAQGIDLVRKIFTIRDRETLKFEYFPLYPQDNGIRIKFLAKSPLTLHPLAEVSVWVIIKLDERHTHITPSPETNYRTQQTRYNGIEIFPVDFNLKNGSISKEIIIKNHRKQFTYQIPELILDNILAEPIKKLPNDVHLYNLKTDDSDTKAIVEEYESTIDNKAYTEYKELLDNIPDPPQDIVYEIDPSLPPSKGDTIEPLPDNYIENTDQMTILGESDSIKEPVKYYTLDMIDLSHMTDDDSKAYLYSTIQQYSNVFAKHNYDIGRTDLLVYDIELKEQPIPQKQRYIKRSIKDEIEPQIKLYLEHGIIEESYNPLYTSNLVLVPKYKSGDRLTSHADMIQQTDHKIDSWRLVQDFRDLNASLVVKYSTTTVPTLEHIYRMNNCVLSSMDILSAYYNIPLTDRAKRLTAFYFGDKIYQWKVLSQGVSNACRSFQILNSLIFSEKTLELALKTLTDQERSTLNRIPAAYTEFLYTYFDDIFCFSATIKIHVIHLKLLFYALSVANIRLSPKKCKFASNSITILGKEFNAQSGILYMDKAKLGYMLSWNRPSSLYELQSRLCQATYWINYILQGKRVTEPLFELIRSKSYKWRITEEKAWNNLMAMIKLDLKLTIPTPDMQLVLSTDASKYSCAQILFCEVDGQLKVADTNSNIFGQQDSQKSTYHKEAIALLRGLKIFEPIISQSNKRLIVFVDAKSLIANKRATSCRIGGPDFTLTSKLLEYQQRYNFELFHVSGQYNFLADIASRSFQNSRYYKRELPLSKEQAAKLPELTDPFYLTSDALYEYLSCEEKPEPGDTGDKSIKKVSVPRPLTNVVKLFKAITPEQKLFSALRILKQSVAESSKKALQSIDLTTEVEKKVLKMNNLITNDQPFSGPLTEKDLSKLHELPSHNIPLTTTSNIIATKITIKPENDTKVMNFNLNTPNLIDMTQVNTVLNATDNLFFSNYYMSNGQINLPKSLELEPKVPQILDINFHVLTNIPYEINSIHPQLEVIPIVDNTKVSFKIINTSKRVITTLPNFHLCTLTTQKDHYYYIVDEELLKKIRLNHKFICNLDLKFNSHSPYPSSLECANSTTFDERMISINNNLADESSQSSEDEEDEEDGEYTTIGEIYKHTLADQKAFLSDNIITNNGLLQSHIFIALQESDTFCKSKKDDPDFIVDRKIMYKKSENSKVLVIPAALATDLIHNLHIRCCHAARGPLTQYILTRYHIPNMKEILDDLYTSCVVCAKINKKAKVKIPLGQSRTFTAYAPNEVVFMDVIHPLPSFDGYTGYLLLMDAHSRYLSAILVKDKSAPSIVHALKTYFMVMSQPSYLYSDNDSGLTKAMSHLQKYFDFSCKTAPTATQQRNSVENSYRQLKDLILKAIHEPSYSSVAFGWPIALIRALNTLNKLPFKRSTISRQDLHFRTTRPTGPFIPPDQISLNDKLITHEELKLDALNLRKKQQAKRTVIPSFKKGQIIYINSKPHTKGISRTYTLSSKGPYKIHNIDYDTKEVQLIKLDTPDRHGRQYKITVSFENLQFFPLNSCKRLNLTDNWDNNFNMATTTTGKKVPVDDIFQDFSRRSLRSQQQQNDIFDEDNPLGNLFESSQDTNLDNDMTPPNSQDQTVSDQNFFPNSRSLRSRIDSSIRNLINDESQPQNENSTLPTINETESLPPISNLQIHDNPIDNTNQLINESPDYPIDPQIDSFELTPSPNYPSTQNISDPMSQPLSPIPGPSSSTHPTTLPKRKKLKPKTKTKQSNKNTPYDQSPPNSQPHQSPIDVIDNNIDNNSPHQFPVLQSNDPPSQTYSQELLDEFNSSDSH